MRSIWFKQCYVHPILEGSKTETIRPMKQNWKAGQQLAATVGPRPPFAVLDIVSLEGVDFHSLPPDYQRTLSRLYVNMPELVRITFRTVRLPTKPA